MINSIRVCSRSSAFFCVVVACAITTQAAPRVARTLSGPRIAAAVTNAPANAKIAVPERNVRPWAAHADWRLADIATHSNAVYICIQAHRSQADWRPPIVPALWRLVRAAGLAPGEIPLWVQPLGAHDAYALGARVRRGGHVWVSIIANNVWAPGVYGWRQED